jgi:hypothetical protein
LSLKGCRRQAIAAAVERERKAVRERGNKLLSREEEREKLLQRERKH